MEKNIKVYAPGRVELLGNHTDYNEGFVLALPLSMGITIEGKARTDDKIIMRSKKFKESYKTTLSKIAPLPDKHWANYVLGVFAELLKRKVKLGGAEINIDSNLPIGAGLASSAALEVATVKFLEKAYKFDLARIELAKVAQKAEHNYVGVRCGMLDQISSLFGEKGKVAFIDFRSYEVENIKIAPCSFLIVHSGVKHALVKGEYNERRASCEAAASKLGLKSLRDASLKMLKENKAKLSETEFKRAMHIVGEDERVQKAVKMLRAGRIEEMGRLMFESHKSSQKYFENSCPELDFIVKTAKNTEGCLGSRLSGGGFGGATVNLLKTGFAKSFAKEIESKYQDKFGTKARVFVA